MGDPYDSYRDNQLTSGGGRDRPQPEWFKRANAERYRMGVASKRAENAMWPGEPIEHGPPHPRREGDTNRQVHRERFS